MMMRERSYKLKRGTDRVISGILHRDTRAFTFFCGLVLIVWSVLIFIPLIVDPYWPAGFLSRIPNYIPTWLPPFVSIPLGSAALIGAVKANGYYWRLIVSFAMVFWWCWMTVIAFEPPLNPAAGTICGCFVVMNIIAVISEASRRI